MRDKYAADRGVEGESRSRRSTEEQIPLSSGFVLGFMGRADFGGGLCTFYIPKRHRFIIFPSTFFALHT